MKNLLICAAIFFAFAGLTIVAANAKGADLKNLSAAKVLIPIEITGLNGNIVSFVIPEDARGYDKRGNAVKVSGLYDTAQGKDASCPYMMSSDIHKTVKNYNPLKGRAVVDAKFSTPELAKAAYDNKCVIIEKVN